MAVRRRFKSGQASIGISTETHALLINLKALLYAKTQRPVVLRELIHQLVEAELLRQGSSSVFSTHPLTQCEEPLEAEGETMLERLRRQYGNPVPAAEE